MVQRYPPKARGTITRQSLLVTVLLSSGKSAGIETPTDPLVGIETHRRHHNLWLVEAGIETLTHRRHHNLRQQLGDQQNLVMRGKAW